MRGMDNLDFDHRQWSPPHWPSRKWHPRNPLAPAWAFKPFGYYRRRAHPRRIREFQNTPCCVTISPQFFSVTYWLERQTRALKLNRRDLRYTV